MIEEAFLRLVVDLAKHTKSLCDNKPEGSSLSPRNILETLVVNSNDNMYYSLPFFDTKDDIFYRQDEIHLKLSLDKKERLRGILDADFVIYSDTPHIPEGEFRIYRSLLEVEEAVSGRGGIMNCFCGHCIPIIKGKPKFFTLRYRDDNGWHIFDKLADPFALLDDPLETQLIWGS